MADAFGRIVLVVGGSAELSIVLKATFIVVLAIVVTQFARGARAALRHALLAAAFGALLILPFGSALMPPVGVNVNIVDPLFVEPPPAVGRSSPAAVLRAVPDVAKPHVTSVAAISTASVLRWTWFIGAIGLLAPLAVGLWKLRGLRREGLPWPEGNALVRPIARDVGIARRVDVLLHEKLPAPMTCGILHPTIVLPADAPGWEERDLRQAFIHELEHVRRVDWLTHIAARGICALYWFHPFVWSAWRHLGLEAEQACDDAVLRGAERTAYADQLLQLARRLSQIHARPALSMANRSDLRVRIAAVLDGSRPRGRAGPMYAAVIVASTVGLVLAISPLRAVPTSTWQVGGPGPTFEAASVKVNKAGGFIRNLMMPGGRYTAENVPLRLLIQNAYQLQPSQLAGGPSWIDSERFDITAKADPASLTPPRVGLDSGIAPLQLMLRALLADRFKLRVHHETRELPIYALVVARADGQLGPKFKAVTEECHALSAARRGGPGAIGPGAPPPPPRPGPLAPGEKLPCGQMMFGPGDFRSGGTAMSVLTGALAQAGGSLSPSIGRIVQDKTGLTGLYEFELQWNPSMDQTAGTPGIDAPPGGTATDLSGPSLFTALQEQLGLRLDARRGPVDVLVIDRIERPVED